MSNYRDIGNFLKIMDAYLHESTLRLSDQLRYLAYIKHLTYTETIARELMILRLVNKLLLIETGNMKYTFNKPLNLKQYARQVLALFVLSLLNMAMQMPAHGTMQYGTMQHGTMQQEMNNTSQAHASHQVHTSHQMADAAAGEMQDCECPSALCEVISALDDQRTETPQSVSFDHLVNINAVYAKHIDAHHQNSAISFIQHKWLNRKITPSPISFNTILLI